MRAQPEGIVLVGAVKGAVDRPRVDRAVSNKVEGAYRRTDFVDKRRLLMRDWGVFVCGREATGKDVGGKADD